MDFKVLADFRDTRVHDRISMDKFKSFLTIQLEEKSDCFGSHNGWTEYRGAGGLIVRGGWIGGFRGPGGVEYLDSIEFGSKLLNPYSNYVNPLCLLHIMNAEGRAFFLDFYAEAITATFAGIDRKIESLRTRRDALDSILNPPMAE